MKKVLFLTKSYPDMRRNASMLCTHRVMECVVESGSYEVHSLCCRYQGEKKYEVVNGVHVHRFRPSLWMRLQHRIVEARKHHKLERLMEVTGKAVTIPIFPQAEPITTIKYIKAAKELHRRENFDAVISEHHGLMTLITGCCLMKTYPKLKHIAILWDPVKGQTTSPYLSKSYTERRINKLEEFASRYTTLQISTLSMKEYHQINGDIVADHRVYLDIPCIIEPEPVVPTEHISLLRKGDINIVFSGLLTSFHRNPEPIITLLNQCDEAERINLLFFSMGAREILENAQKSFKGNIVIHDYIPLNELHTLYLHADYLLNISHVNAKMVPSKIFEYMSYGKPIISTYVTDGDSAQKYLCRYIEGLCVDLKRSDEENVGKLNMFLAKEHKQVPFDEVKEEFKENVPDTFLKVIKDIIDKD